MPELDVYRDWLRIAETARPLTYYQLLRLPQFCDDAAKTRDHYRKMNAHVRKYAAGGFARQSQELLNELAKAMLCLTDAQRKREYDASLGRKADAEGKRRTLEEILLADKTIDRDQLAKARSYADAVGLEVRDALLQRKMAAADVIMLAYAESVGLPYVELEDVGVDEQLVPQVPATIARQYSCVPVMIDENKLLMASPNMLVPDVEEELRLRFEMPVRTVLCTAAGVNAAIAKYFPRDAETAPAAAPKQKQQPAASSKQQKDEPKPERPPLSQEEKSKRRIMAAIVSFNAAVMLTIVAAMFLRGGMAFVKPLDFMLAVAVGSIVAGAAFVIAIRQDK